MRLNLLTSCQSCGLFLKLKAHPCGIAGLIMRKRSFDPIVAQCHTRSGYLNILNRSASNRIIMKSSIVNAMSEDPP